MRVVLFSAVILKFQIRPFLFSVFEKAFCPHYSPKLRSKPCHVSEGGTVQDKVHYYFSYCNIVLILLCTSAFAQEFTPMKMKYLKT